jgi:peptide deformylase
MIITNNEDALRVFCHAVNPEEIGSLVETLEKELDYANRLGKGGIGLAAPQIGIAKHIAIVRLGEGLNFNLINANLEQGFDPTIFKEEGCLSFPGRVEDTTRFQEVVISNNGLNKFVATGLVAVVCQHEIDHLNSVLFMDRKIVKAAVPFIKNKVGPNQLCPCGKIKKYKKCCGK